MSDCAQTDFLDASIRPLYRGLFEPKGVSEAGRAVFFLPTYQRPYAWERRQREDFWNDLQDAFRQTAEANDAQADPYLLGTLYLARLTTEDWSREVHADVVAAYRGLLLNRALHPAPECLLVVDGQQRITTFFLFCLGVPELRAALFIDDWPRLALGWVDLPCFQAIARGALPVPQTRSHRRLIETQRFFAERLADLERQGQRAAFVAFVRYHLQAVFIELKDNLRLATTLFVSQTDRGKRLTVLERLKSTLVFYGQRAGVEDHSQAIDNLFGKLYERIEQLVERRIFRRGDEAEADVARILHVLLKRRGFYRTDWREPERPDIGWEAGEESIYEFLSTVLRLSQRSGQLDLAIREVRQGIEDIADTYAWLVEAARHEATDRFVSHFDGGVWHPLLQTFGVLGLSRFFKAWLVDLHRRRQDDPSLFMPLAAKGTGRHFESLLIREIGPETPIREVGGIQERLAPLLALLGEGDGTIQREDLRLVLAHPSAALLAGQLRRTLNRLDGFAGMARSESISVFNLAETLELSMWGIGKRPVSFFDYPENIEGLLRHSLSWASSYKTHYLLRDLDYGKFKYLLLCYERALLGRDAEDFGALLDLDVNEDDGIAVHREHIFARSPQADLSDPIRRLWSNSGPIYDDWIWRIGNIALLEHDKNIGEASNRAVWEKAEVYRGSRFFHTRELGAALAELDAVFTDASEPDTTLVTRLAAFKLLLDIREVELLGFAQARF